MTKYIIVKDLLSKKQIRALKLSCKFGFKYST